MGWRRTSKAEDTSKKPAEKVFADEFARNRPACNPDRVLDLGRGNHLVFRNRGDDTGEP